MDWKSYAIVLLALLPMVKCWTFTNSEATSGGANKQMSNAVSPYIDIVLCPIRAQPWSCAREQSGRILNIWDDELKTQWQKLKVEADRQLNATIEKRGYSATEVLTKEKPSTILKKIEIGTGFMKEYLSETMDGFLGREYEYQNTKNEENTVDNDGDTGDVDEDDNDNETAVEEDDAEDEAEDNEDDDTDDDDDIDDENEKNTHVNEDSKENTAQTAVNTSVDGDEFIEINDDANQLGQLKRPSFGGNKGNKRKKKKKGSSLGQPATLVLVAHDDHESDVAQWQGDTGGGHGHGHGGGHGGGKQKKKRRKKKQRPVQHVEQASSDHFGLGGILDELVGAEDMLGGGKKKFKHSTKYGRSNGVTRGKKKKKKKALAKLVLLGSFLKAKIELLLKLLGAHLQIKFFAIALIGLLINIARFWIDVKRGGLPQKVVYVEHAHHQHHYEEQADDWSEPGGGGYWKRSLQTDPSVEDKSEGGFTDSYQLRPQSQSQYDAQYMAYRNQWQ